MPEDLERAQASERAAEWKQGCCKNITGQTVRQEAHQRVLLSGGQVQGGVVQAVHKVPQARHVHLVLHGLCGTRHHTHTARWGCVPPFQTSAARNTHWCKWLTAATGTRISTKRPAKACLMSLSLTSRKYWAHSCKKTLAERSLSREELPSFKSVDLGSKKCQLQDK